MIRLRARLRIVLGLVSGVSVRVRVMVLSTTPHSTLADVRVGTKMTLAVLCHRTRGALHARADPPGRRPVCCLPVCGNSSRRVPAVVDRPRIDSNFEFESMNFFPDFCFGWWGLCRALLARHAGVERTVHGAFYGGG